MGYELDKLMKQYGVSTPGVITYSGATEQTVPGLAAYQKEYQNRMQNTPMYMQQQFQTGAEPKSEGYNWATTHQGLPQFNRDIKNWAADNQSKNTYSDDINAFAEKYNLSPIDIYNATGSRWGNVLQAPRQDSKTPSPAGLTGAKPDQPPAKTALTDTTQPAPAPTSNPPSPLGLTGLKPDKPAGWGDDPFAGGPSAPSAPQPEPPPVYQDPHGSEALSNPTTQTKGGYEDVLRNIYGVEGTNPDVGQPENDGLFDVGGRRRTRMAKGGPVKSYGPGARSGDVGDGYVRPWFMEDTPSARRERQASPQDYEMAPRDPLPPSTAVAANDLPSDEGSAIDIPTTGSAATLPEVTVTAKRSMPSSSSPEAALLPKSDPFSSRMANIRAMLEAYGPSENNYSEELKTAREKAGSERETFTQMLADSRNSPEDAQSSKAEMYLRLAAAFGAPTKTGSFSENLGMAGQQLADYTKSQRAENQQKLALALKGQEMNVQGSKEDLRALQNLSAEDMKDKRAIASKLIEEYVKSGEPQSMAGKQAKDEGLVPGTPEYQKRTAEIGQMLVDAKQAQITSTLGNLSVAQQNAETARLRYENLINQQSKLQGPEIKMKKEAQDNVVQLEKAMNDLDEAFRLNDESFDGTWTERGARFLLENTFSEDKRVVATRRMEILLQKGALAALKSTFVGSISNEERKALMDVQGIGAKSRPERAAIMMNAFKALRAMYKKQKDFLAEIESGRFRATKLTEMPNAQYGQDEGEP